MVFLFVSIFLWGVLSCISFVVFIYGFPVSERHFTKADESDLDF